MILLYLKCRSCSVVAIAAAATTTFNMRLFQVEINRAHDSDGDSPPASGGAAGVHRAYSRHFSLPVAPLSLI
jgi:hypothetical protein